MRDTFPFLSRLGLGVDAGATDIRRAYARELKKINQESDPDGFQELRQAYEVALQWLAHQEIALAESEPAVTSMVADPEPMPAPVPPLESTDPYQLADQAFSLFQSSAQALVLNNESRHQSRWKAALQGCLDHESLLNLTARTIFEARIAHMLATGWKPGHETLFVVASEVLDWARDSRRIQQFGEAGAMIDRAIDQWKLYESMPDNAKVTIKQLIQAVRSTPYPEGVATRNNLLLFHQLTDRFYHWFSVILDRETLQNWHNAAQAEIQRNGTDPAVPLQYLETPAETGKSSSSGWSGWSGWQITFLILMLIKGCAALINSSDHGTSYTPPPAQLEQASPGKTTAQQRLEELQSRIEPGMLAHKETVPSEAQLEAVQRQIFYVPDPAKVLGVLKVSFDVELDGSGQVINVKKVKASSDQAYDDAVARTLMHTNAFPPGTQRRFTVSYSYKTGGL